MKIVTVLGARPQFVKASAISALFAKQEGVQEIVVHTGQHYDANMSDVFFAELGMERPSHILDIHGGSHGAMTGRMLEAVESVLQAESPDLVLVYGDTNSTLAGALAAVKLHIPVAHVEAGLRSFNVRMPEEINRVLTDRISTWLFAPTRAAVQHLKHEGVDPATIHHVGDVMYDVAMLHGPRATSRLGAVIPRLGLIQKGFVLATVHRAENTDDATRMAVIVEALIRVAKEMPVVWPLHPRTRHVLSATGGLGQLEQSGVRLIDPLGYLDMVELEQAASVIVTDSGGVQKEAFFFGVPCVTLREETEWVELVDAGWNRLIEPRDASAVSNALFETIGTKGKPVAPYGDGNAASAIVHVLTH